MCGNRPQAQDGQPQPPAGVDDPPVRFRRSARQALLRFLDSLHASSKRSPIESPHLSTAQSVAGSSGVAIIMQDPTRLETTLLSSIGSWEGHELPDLLTDPTSCQIVAGSRTPRRLVLHHRTRVPRVLKDPSRPSTAFAVPNPAHADRLITALFTHDHPRRGTDDERVLLHLIAVCLVQCADLRYLNGLLRRGSERVTRLECDVDRLCGILYRWNHETDA